MSASLVDGGYQAGRNFQVPHRRPVPPVSGVPQRMQPLTRIVPDHQYDGTPQQSQGHMHSRTVSSIAMPAALVSQPHQPQQYQTAQPQYQNYTNPQMQQQSTRRTLSNGTASTSSTSNAPIRKNSGSTNLQRTASSLSGGSTNSPTSYVALMRKQKATVWCDRAQHEDPRLIAQQKAARLRAQMEVSRSNSNDVRIPSSGNGTMTGGVRSRIRTYGAPKAREYAPTTNPASGVPMRLSARELDQDESDEDHARSLHQRTGSGRSSLGSASRVTSMYGLQPGNAGTPGSGSASRPTSQGAPVQQEDSISDQTPVPDNFKGTDYFSRSSTVPRSNGEPQSTNSGGSEEESFGDVGGLPHVTRGPETEEQLRKQESDLARRGSVDERTTTMRGYGRLFVANPDVD